MLSLEKALQTFITEAVSSDMDLCLTITSKKNSLAWVQMTWDALNVPYPSSIAPLQFLQSIGVALPRGVELVEYESGSFATFHHDANDIRGFAQFVMQYFLAVFKIEADIDSIVLEQEEFGRKKNAIQPPSEINYKDSQIHLRQLMDKAAAFQANRQKRQAVEAYSEIIQFAPDYVHAYVERGLLLQEMGYPEKAFVDFEKAIYLDPQCGAAYYGRGWVKHMKGDFNGEIQDARKGLSLDGKHAGMYYRRIGAALQGLKKYREAIEAYNAAIQFYSGSEEGTIYNRGMCFLEMKEYDLALADFNRSLEMDPDWAWALASRGRTYLNMGDCKKANDDCTMAIQYQPNYYYSYLTRGLAYEELGDSKKARKDYEQVMQMTNSEQLKKSLEQQIQNLKSGWRLFG